jgi:hypothetical protein
VQRRRWTAAGVSPVTKKVNAGGVVPGKRSSSRVTRSDWLPGTSQPPPERYEVWWNENQAHEARITSQTATTARR